MPEPRENKDLCEIKLILQELTLPNGIKYHEEIRHASKELI